MVLWAAHSSPVFFIQNNTAPLRPRDTVYVISRLQSEISKIPGSDSWDARKLKDTGVALVGLVDRCEILKKPWPMYGLPRKPKDTRVALVGLVEKQPWDRALRRHLTVFFKYY